MDDKLSLNSFVSFAIEVVAVVAIGWVPFAVPLNRGVQIALCLVLVGAFVAAWARFAAPRSDKRLRGWPLLAFKAMVFLLTGALLGLRFGTWVLAAVVLIMIVNLAIEFKPLLRRK